MKDEEIKLPELTGSHCTTKAFGVEARYYHQEDVTRMMKEAVRMNHTLDASTRSQAESWKEVAATLDKLAPKWWQTGDARCVDAAINTITKAFQSNVPSSEPLPFNLEAAKRGEPLVTRDGRNVRLIGHDTQNSTNTPVIVLIEGDTKYNAVNLSGAYYSDRQHDYDVFMKPKPMLTAWVTQKSDGTITVGYDEMKQIIDAANSDCNTYTSSVLIPDHR